MDVTARPRSVAINEDWDEPISIDQTTLRRPTRPTGTPFGLASPTVVAPRDMTAPPALAHAPAVSAVAPGHRAAARVKRAADPRRPYHVGVAIGVSAGLYAASLGAVTNLQIATDRQVIEDRQPVSTAIDVLGRSHEDLTQRLAAARDSYTAANSQFSSLAGDMKALHDRLVALRGQLATLDQTTVPGAVSLPKLPAVRGGGSVKAPPAPRAAPPPPPVHAKTGPSGGG